MMMRQMIYSGLTYLLRPSTSCLWPNRKTAVHDA